MVKKKTPKTSAKKGLLIVKLNWLDAIMLTGIGFSLASILHSHYGRLENALAFMFIAMLVDSMDRVFARLLKMERLFGRYLDGFIHFLIYIIAPAVFFYYYGFERLNIVWILLLFGAAGIIRLSVYDQVGEVRTKGRFYQSGMPVAWSHFVAAALYFMALVFRGNGMVYFAGAVLLCYAFLMLLNRRFPDFETNPVMYGVIAALIVIFFWIGFGKGQPVF